MQALISDSLGGDTAHTEVSGDRRIGRACWLPALAKTLKGPCLNSGKLEHAIF